MAERLPVVPLAGTIVNDAFPINNDEKHIHDLQANDLLIFLIKHFNSIILKSLNLFE